jgi:cell wall-associated NlpC family hydrolase
MFFASIRISRVLASLLSIFLYVRAGTQTPAAQPQDDSVVRMVSRLEGEAIVEAAWELRHGLSPKPDCSHFVNAIYERVGLAYDYASSSEVFEGIDSFKRVLRPQPGDLVVWRGHIGIVIDPDEHTFYSSVIRGFAIEDYRSHYWVSRGRPRFYRYLIDETHSALLLAHRENPQ